MTNTELFLQRLWIISECKNYEWYAKNQFRVDVKLIQCALEGRWYIFRKYENKTERIEKALKCPLVLNIDPTTIFKIKMYKWRKARGRF